MTAPVFICDDGFAEDVVRPGARYVLGGPEGKHAGVVQRRSVGERIDVVDGSGLRLECVVSAGYADGVLPLTVHAVVREAAAHPRLVLVQALAKGTRDDQAIEAAVECGVDGIIPWQADRSIVQWRGERGLKAHRGWESVVRAATKQSRRAWLPGVESVVTSKVLARRIAGSDSMAGGAIADAGAATSPRGAIVLHEEAEVPLSDAVLPDHGDVLVIVGPEGGISDAELAAFSAAGAQAVRLGPHVMRTSTAGPVAIAMLAQRLGRW
ncbi:MAG: 16S rRNA (uracil(1498)-N(3))-methyltransferase [Cellulomonadaceae bacterium]|jgi:16S rRNA (uracil1498-N3)-methyltransferase|nr:16S rRNA (uracil(1498)-N(3))-methyltransferase [Cellulomonadaceae bacterium]